MWRRHEEVEERVVQDEEDVEREELEVKNLGGTFRSVDSRGRL